MNIELLEECRKQLKVYKEHNGRGASQEIEAYTGTTRQNLHKFEKGKGLGPEFLRKLAKFLWSKGLIPSHMMYDHMPEIRQSPVSLPDTDSIFKLVRTAHDLNDNDSMQQLLDIAKEKEQIEIAVKGLSQRFNDIVNRLSKGEKNEKATNRIARTTVSSKGI